MYGTQVLDHLDEQMAGFIQRSPFLQLATADAAGLPFVSPKGDDAGFVMVVDERTLAIPDRPGNSILMGLQAILANPNAGLCFEIPGYSTTLRVGGRAELSNDPELLHRLEARGLDAMLAIVIEVEYAFFHCAKAYLRSRLWEPDSWPSGEEQCQVGMSQYFADSEEDVERLDGPNCSSDSICFRFAPPWICCPDFRWGTSTAARAATIEMVMAPHFPSESELTAP